MDGAFAGADVDTGRRAGGAGRRAGAAAGRRAPIPPPLRPLCLTFWYVVKDGSNILESRGLSRLERSRRGERLVVLKKTTGEASELTRIHSDSFLFGSWNLCFLDNVAALLRCLSWSTYFGIKKQLTAILICCFVIKREKEIGLQLRVVVLILLEVMTMNNVMNRNMDPDFISPSRRKTVFHSSQTDR